MKILQFFKGDKTIWLLVMALSAYSVMGVYSASGRMALSNNSGMAEGYMIKQFVILLGGFFAMWVAHRIPYRAYAKISFFGLALAVPLLLYTLIGGHESGDARRWIIIPFINLTFQPSDLAKVMLIIFLAYMISKKISLRNDFKRGFLPLLIPVIVVCGLILRSNFSTAFMIFVVSMVMMYVGQVEFKFLASTVAAGLLLFVLVVIVGASFPKTFPRAETWANRITNWTDDASTQAKVVSDGHMQAEQAKTAIATGGWAGKMPGKSVQRNFLPSAFSDFIFAIIIEEYGFIFGAFPIVMLYVILLFRGLRIAIKADTSFGAIMAIGITFSILSQAMVNMLVASGIGPVTGQTLPMISYGGTSIIFVCISLGILQSIARGNEEVKTVEETATHIVQPIETEGALA